MQEYNTPIDQLVGKKVTGFAIPQPGDEEVRIVTDAGKEYRFYHLQDCCESVRVHSAFGDSPLGCEILSVEKQTWSREDPDWVASDDEVKTQSYRESWTWTEHRITSTNGIFTIRWLGESNGYYGEEVYFTEV